MARAYPGSLKAESAQPWRDQVVYVVLTAADEPVGQTFTVLHSGGWTTQESFVAAAIGWVHP
jgi:hypothetical protein